MCDTGPAPGGLATRAQIFRLFRELKRRKVFRITAGYAVASFVVIQIADILVPALDLSQHVVLWVLIALVVGLPIALALSWRYDLSPEGLKFTGAVEDENGNARCDGRQVSARRRAAGRGGGAAVRQSHAEHAARLSRRRNPDRAAVDSVACARSARRLAAVRRGSLGHAHGSADDCEKPHGAIRDLGQRRRSR